MLNLLAIDDSLTIRKIVEMTLRGQAVNVTLCEDAKQGRDFLDRTTPDLILLDYVLPDLNGAEFLHSLPENLQQIPVIIMTTKDLSIREQFRDFSQVIGYLTKPFSQNQLIQKVKSSSNRTSKRTNHQATKTINSGNGPRPFIQPSSLHSVGHSNNGNSKACQIRQHLRRRHYSHQHQLAGCYRCLNQIICWHLLLQQRHQW